MRTVAELMAIVQLVIGFTRNSIQSSSYPPAYMTFSKNQANYHYIIPHPWVIEATQRCMKKSSTVALPHLTAATLELSRVPLITEQLHDLWKKGLDYFGNEIDYVLLYLSINNENSTFFQSRQTSNTNASAML